MHHKSEKPLSACRMIFVYILMVINTARCKENFILKLCIKGQELIVFRLPCASHSYKKRHRIDVLSIANRWVPMGMCVYKTIGSANNMEG